jgi:hypothetical protein
MKTGLFPVLFTYSRTEEINARYAFHARASPNHGPRRGGYDMSQFESSDGA